MLNFLLNPVFLTGCSKFKFCSSKNGVKNDGTAHFKDLVINVHHSNLIFYGQLE